MSPFTRSLILGSLTSARPFSHGFINKLLFMGFKSPNLLLRPLRRAEGTEGFRNNMFRVHSFYGFSHNSLLIVLNGTEVVYTQGGKGRYLLTSSGCSHSKINIKINPRTPILLQPLSIFFLPLTEG